MIKNIKKTLQNCDLMAEQMFENEDEQIRFEYLSQIELVEEESLDKSLIDDDGNEIKKIGNYYRNASKDTYCSYCGAIVTEYDQSCPECLREFEVTEEAE